MVSVGSFVIDFTGLTHQGRVTHICVSKLTIIGSDYGFRLNGVKLLSEPMLLILEP